MPRVNVGTLHQINAFLDGETIYLVGSGVAPTSGWKHDFQNSLSSEMGEHYVFVSFPPTGMVLQVLTPFVAVEKIPKKEHPSDSIRVLYRKPDNSVGVDQIPIKPATASDMGLVQHLSPVTIYPADDPRIDAAPDNEFADQPFEVCDKGKGTVYRRVIASFNNPLDCWFSGSSNEWILEVRVGTPQDIKGAVEDCLKLGAVAAAVAAIAAVMVTGGAALAAAIEAFIAVIKPCLAAKLSNLASVTVHHKHSCN